MQPACFEYIDTVVGMRLDQGRPSADWTDCFQSGPTREGPRATPTNLRNVTLFIEAACVAPARVAGPTVFLGVGPVANENQSEPRVC